MKTARSVGLLLLLSAISFISCNITGKQPKAASEENVAFAGSKADSIREQENKKAWEEANKYRATITDSVFLKTKDYMSDQETEGKFEIIKTDEGYFDIKPVTASIRRDTVEGHVLQYKKRMSLQRFSNIPITHLDAYKIKTQYPVYSSLTDKIQLDVINVNAPTAEPEYHHLEQWENGKWVIFPFIDNLAFAGVGRDLSKGDTLPENIYMSEFKNVLKPNKYKVHFYVFANIYTDFILTNDSILPVNEDSKKTALHFHVLKSTKDSIRVLFENHTNLRVLPSFLPSVGQENLYSAHPLARSGWIGEHQWMQKHAFLNGGEAILFSIPTSWDINCLGNPSERERFKSGKLAPGKYKLGLQAEIYMTTEFEVK